MIKFIDTNGPNLYQILKNFKQKMVVDILSRTLPEDSLYIEMARNLIKDSAVSPEHIIAQFIHQKIQIPKKPGEGSFINGSNNSVTFQIEVSPSKSLK